MVRKASNTKENNVSKNKLTFDSLQKIDKKNDEIKLITVNGYQIKLNKVFRDSKIQALLGEFIDIQKELKDIGIPAEEMDMTGIVFGLIFKHFTDLPIPEKVNGLMQYVQMLVDNKFFEQIVNSLEQDQLEKVTQGMRNAITNANFLLNQDTEPSV